MKLLRKHGIFIIINVFVNNHISADPSLKKQEMISENSSWIVC